MTDFTPTQGRYLAFIQAYTDLHGYPPAEAEIAGAMCVSPPSVNLMVKALEKKGLIERQPGRPRSLRVLVPLEEVPPWGNRKVAASVSTSAAPKKKPAPAPAAKLYILKVYLTGGPIIKKFAGKECSRVIEIRGDQTLADLHQAIFDAFDREEQHFYQFQFGKRPFDPKGPNYGIPAAGEKTKDARTTTLDDLKIKPFRAFGYWFDFGDDWFHEIHLDKTAQAIAHVRYPRVIKRVGKSPPQYPDLEEESGDNHGEEAETQAHHRRKKSPT